MNDEVLLCDCPGLVFPSFVSTKAEMILNGILPIDQMRDHVPPVSLISFYMTTSYLSHVHTHSAPADSHTITFIRGWGGGGYLIPGLKRWRVIRDRGLFSNHVFLRKFILTFQTLLLHQ